MDGFRRRVSPPRKNALCSPKKKNTYTDAGSQNQRRGAGPEKEKKKRKGKNSMVAKGGKGKGHQTHKTSCGEKTQRKFPCGVGKKG